MAKKRQEHKETDSREKKPQEKESQKETETQGKGSQKEKGSREKEPQKERKVKVVYYDDGSTVVDMSGTRKGNHLPERQKATFREKARTFFAAMRKMVIPMLCTLAAFTLIYLFLLAITGKLW